MKPNDGTSIFHRQLLGRILAEAMLHPETQSCDCLLCRHRAKKVAEERARLLDPPAVV